MKVTRKELLERWSVIEQEDDGDGASSLHPVKRRRFRQLKEQWFADAFSFLIYLPKQDHIWCGYWELMGPLLEAFYNYFKDEQDDSPLKLLWSRASVEMRSCTMCIHQHHQAQEMYATEYEQSCVRPLLDVLQMLDEERIVQHLKDINSRIRQGKYDPSQDYGQVVSVMFEVLMFPILLDDQALASEFQLFLEAVDNIHELMLEGHQQYPGVYALLFSKSRRVRSIGLRLAGNMGKLRRSTDLDPLQHLLQKCICLLETESLEMAQTSRPRVQLDQITVWLGMKTLIGFLEPPALEEGILDRYPIFLSIVLNHISDDSAEFSHAVNCLRLLFEKLGCKLWLRATLSPSVMRNTLLGQCFHTRDEKSHKEIFDLFLPFLQSLEALQDGEHEKQRRHFLYFLLHQVPVSSNFSLLMRKKACQIALLIALRGYNMDPPCPPSECAHMWGPSLVSSLKDTSLHSSLRQPAFDLIQTIIVSDASALMSVVLNGELHPNDKSIRHDNYDGMDEEGRICSFLRLDENADSSWKEFILQHKIISQVDENWMCIPMLWFDVLVEIDPLVLPLSFSKAVFWALSRFSMLEPENSSEMTLSVRNWLATHASEISHLFGWKVPSGSDDGGDGTEAKNSIKTSMMCLPLVRTFKRLTAHYTVRMAQGELRNLWTWEPIMSDSLILLLVDRNDNTRQVAKLILEQVSKTRGLTLGLQFLCSEPASLFSILLGLRHGLTLIKLDSVLSNFQTLHHLFFVLCKLLKEGYSSMLTVAQNQPDVTVISNSMEGGFLKQHTFDSTPAADSGHSSSVSSMQWKNFSTLLSQIAWPSILKCLDGGKAFMDDTKSQMSCVRLLEVIPVVFERLPFDKMMVASPDMKWLCNLADWGKSSLAVVVRYWKLTVSYLLSQIRSSCSDECASVVTDIEKLISHEIISMDLVNKQVSRLSLLLVNKASSLKKAHMQSKNFTSVESLNSTASAEQAEIAMGNEAIVGVLDSEPLADRDNHHYIVLSDDDVDEPDISARMGLSDMSSSPSELNDTHASTRGSGIKSIAGKEKSFNTNGQLTKSRGVSRTSYSSETDLVDKKISSDGKDDKEKKLITLQAEPSDGKRTETQAKDGATEYSIPPNSSNYKKKYDETSSSEHPSTSKPHSGNKAGSGTRMASASDARQSVIKPLKASAEMIDDIVRDTADVIKPLKANAEMIEDIVRDTADDDAWNFSFFKRPKSSLSLSINPTSRPKRQAIQLSLPVNGRLSSMKSDIRVKRFQAPRLDDWFRLILKLDFFVVVGLAVETDADCQNVHKLKEVPVNFESPDAYVEIFRPLLLEEFKAQLQNSYQEMISAEEICRGRLSVLSVERIDDFQVVRFVHDESDFTGSKGLLENDLILLTKRPLGDSTTDVHIIGKVERREKDNKRRLNISAIKLYLQGCSRLNQARKLLTERSKWHVTRVMSITPQLREFQALSSIREIPLLPAILNPGNHSSDQYESRTENINKLSQPLQQIFNSSYNTSQLQAINLAVGPFDFKKDFELTLIQGPPGTGKTSTIVAIVSGLIAFSRRKEVKSLRNDSKSYRNSSNPSQRINQTAAIARAWQDAALARQLNKDTEDNASEENCRRGRILICAQSNAAVDELVARISNEGLFDHTGHSYKPYLVRVGNAKTVHPSSMPFFIDTLIEHRLEENRTGHDDNENATTCADSLTTLRANLEKLVDRIKCYEAKRANLQETGSDSKNVVDGDCGGDGVLADAKLEEKLRQLYEEKKKLYANLANMQAKEKKAGEEVRALRHKYRMDILKEAEVVVATLSGCGGDLYGVCSETTSGHKFTGPSENYLFDAVVIDEAAQALEPATLIPLQLLKSRGTKCVMVGDPKQLPATVLSNIATKYSFQCSMFERLQRAGHPVIMLTQQYRMHPEICHFPSSHFYEGKLLNGTQMSDKAAPFHATWCLGPYIFFDIIDGKEQRGKNTGSLSMYNESEADAAVEVLKHFKKSYPTEFLSRRIGIITPYKRQISLLRSRISTAFGSSVADDIEFNTVDGFQGREVDVLLLSTVRAAGLSSTEPNLNSGSIGFVADVRRMNVALTRARLALWIFGNARTLQANRSWAALVEDAKNRNLVISGKRPYSSICMKSSIPMNSNISSQSEKAERAEAIDRKNKKQRPQHIASERKRKFDENSLKSGGVSTSANNGAEDGKRKGRFRREIPPPKEIRSVKVSSNDSNVSNRVRSTGEENSKKTEKSLSKGADDERSLPVRADVGTKKDSDSKSRDTDSFGKFKNVNQNKRPTVTNPMHTKTSKHVVDINKSESRSMIAEVKEGASNQVEVPKDSIMKRKQQREAVDALLSSALISSKKPEPSSKLSSSKRAAPVISHGKHPSSQRRKIG